MSAPYEKVSVHGGHSGTYCNHARDSLADVVQRYVDLGFSWVCLTEHMPTRNPSLLPPEEAAAGLDVAALQQRFAAYFAEARRLAEQHADSIELLVGFETEAYTGYEAEVEALISEFQPDMIVGSVHHIRDILYDAGESHYQQAARACGGLENMYCEYFDRQLELINRFEPAVVGHFDLIRIFDPDYPQRWQVPAIRERALRNLDRIKALGLILDLNVRALAKGAAEPYISAPWLRYAIDQGIAICTGDDSHGVDNVGKFLPETVQTLTAAGGSTAWTKPVLRRHVH